MTNDGLVNGFTGRSLQDSRRRSSEASCDCISRQRDVKTVI